MGRRGLRAIISARLMFNLVIFLVYFNLQGLFYITCICNVFFLELNTDIIF